jgi:hypothetical protein
MLSKKSSGHVGSGGVKHIPVQKSTSIGSGGVNFIPVLSQQKPSQLEPPPQQQELQETVFRIPKQKIKKLKYQRE